MGSKETCPYWNINVPESKRTDICPEALLNLSPKDLDIISTPDNVFRPQTWTDVQDLVRRNDLAGFRRKPSDLRRYRIFVHTLAKQHGSVANFVFSNRLQWEAPARARGRPFEFADDIKILYNDWPYGVDRRIVHLVVWTKFVLCEDPETGDLTDETRGEIASFMSRTFYAHIPEDQVLWFKNWSDLKSVHAVEHFHVMLLDPDPTFLSMITNQDIPHCQRFG